MHGGGVRSGVHWPIAAVGCFSHVACASSTSGTHADQVRADGGEGGNAATSTGAPDAARGGAPYGEGGGALRDGGSSGQGGAGTSCTEPPAIDPATWPTCSVTDGGTTTEAVPQGVVLAEAADEYLGQAVWAGDLLYLASLDCGQCYGHCSIPFPGCSLSIGFVEPCSRALVPTGSGTSYDGSQFAATSDAVFWTTRGDNPPPFPVPWLPPTDLGRGSLYGAVAGSTTATQLRGGELVFSNLTAHADRLYWIESEWDCSSATLSGAGCEVRRGTMVSAPARTEALLDGDLTVLYEQEDAPDGGDGDLDLREQVALAVDDMDAYVLQGGKIHRVPLTGGPPTPFADCVTGGNMLAVDDGYVYASNYVPGPDGGTGAYSIVKVSKVSGTCEVLASNAARTFSVHDGLIFFVEPGEGSCTSIVRRVPRNGGPPELIVSAGTDGANVPTMRAGRPLLHFYNRGGPSNERSRSSMLIELTP